jgi:uncharacterized protein with HEPN domain
LRSGVERQFAIVGEALSQIRRIDPALGGSIAELARVVGFRNVLIHACASVDSRIVSGHRGSLPRTTAPLPRSPARRTVMSQAPRTQWAHARAHVE